MSAVPSSACTAFVLTGGGSLGAVQVGMLEALFESGIVPDLVVGASAGAINAAIFASSPDRRGIEMLSKLWRALRRHDVFPFSLARTAWCLTGRGSHWMSSDPLRKLLESALPNAHLEHSTLPCHVLATDALDGTGVLLSRGCTTSALLASAAIPAVFPPVVIDGRPLIDGGLATETPIEYAARLGAIRIFVLPTGTPCALRAPPRGVFACAIHALNLLSMRQLLADVDRCATSRELCVVPPLCPLRVNPYDFSHTTELIERAATSTRHWLRGGMAPRDPRWALLPHRH